MALALAVFASALVLDLATGRYVLAMGAARAHAAARWSVMMCLCSTLATLAIVEDSRWMLLPQCVGLYAGTLVAARIRPQHTPDA